MNQHKFIEWLGVKINLISANMMVATSSLATRTHAHHDTLHISYTIKGKGYCTVNNQRYILKPGVIHIVFPNEVHKYEPDHDDPYTVYFVHISWFGEISNISRVFKISKRHTLNSLFKQITDLCWNLNSPTGEIRKYSLMCLILAELLDLSQNKRVNENQAGAAKAGVDGRLHLALAQLNGPPFQFPGIDKLASRLGMSKRAFQIFFRNNIDMTAREYFLKNKMAYAKNLLDSQEFIKKEVAMMCGYSNTQNFTRAFRDFMKKLQ